LAVIRAPLENYPPSIYQVGLLAESGLRVGVVDTRHDQYPLIDFKPAGNVVRIHGGPHTLMHKEKLPNVVGRIRRQLTLMSTVRRSLKQFKPKVVIAYDDHACPMVGMLGSNRRPWVIAHFHELSTYKPGDGFGLQRAHRYCRRFARAADLVVFPDAYR